jgi:hypothetical protein
MVFLHTEYLDIKPFVGYRSAQKRERRIQMFQMYPGALEAEMERRIELASATMQAVHGKTGRRRVAGVSRFRHAVEMLVLGAVVFVR